VVVQLLLLQQKAEAHFILYLPSFKRTRRQRFSGRSLFERMANGRLQLSKRTHLVVFGRYATTFQISIRGNGGFRKCKNRTLLSLIYFMGFSKRMGSVWDYIFLLTDWGVSGKFPDTRIQLVMSYQQFVYALLINKDAKRPVCLNFSVLVFVPFFLVQSAILLHVCVKSLGFPVHNHFSRFWAACIIKSQDGVFLGSCCCITCLILVQVQVFLFTLAPTYVFFFWNVYITTLRRMCRACFVLLCVSETLILLM